MSVISGFLLVLGPLSRGVTVFEDNVMVSRPIFEKERNNRSKKEMRGSPCCNGPKTVRVSKSTYNESEIVLLTCYSFLVACTRLYTPLCRSVGPSVGPSVGRSVTLYFFGVFELFGLTAPAQMLR